MLRDSSTLATCRPNTIMIGLLIIIELCFAVKKKDSMMFLLDRTLPLFLSIQLKVAPNAQALSTWLIRCINQMTAVSVRGVSSQPYFEAH